MTVMSDGEIYEDDFIFGSVSNSTSVAGIVKLSKDLVDVRDGLFEVLLVRYPRNAVELSRVVHGITMTDFTGDMFKFFKTSEIKFEMNDPVPWTLDGEYAEGSNIITVTNMHNAITIKK